MKRTLIKHVLTSDQIGEPVKIAGWVRTRRDSKGGFSFIEINDGSSFSGLQVIVPGELDNYESEVKRLSSGCAVRATGTLEGVTLILDGEEAGSVVSEPFMITIDTTELDAYLARTGGWHRESGPRKPFSSSLTIEYFYGL